ncbi:phosphatidate phosphatase LPIN1-like isoform X2 [Engraulis encrasicolus]|uniref:phosphatidate phosphatase LPIN1-like isoform X2 n=1 Tax=Engraulis encrasicolus TaxID=184585 RepID=UPI002FD13522
MTSGDGPKGIYHAEQVEPVSVLVVLMDSVEQHTEEEVQVEEEHHFGEDEDIDYSTWSWSQTMNYVGQLAGQVLVQVKELYRGLNPATLSGCIDVIVVRQPDGSLHCSPFHVRFGKMGVLRSREKVVDIEINGEPVSLHMKLGENGEAFFVKEMDNNQEVVPAYLATSPIPSDDGSLLMGGSSLLMGGSHCHSPMPMQTAGSLGGGGGGGEGGMKKRRKRRRKSKVDSVKREGSGEYSEDEDMFTIDISSNEAEEADNMGRSSGRDLMATGSSHYKASTVYASSDGDWSPIQSPGTSRPSSPKSDSELLNKQCGAKQEQDNPAMLWAWGELPQAAKRSFLPPKPSLSSPTVRPVSIPVSEDTHFRVIPPGGDRDREHITANHNGNDHYLKLVMPTATATTKTSTTATATATGKSSTELLTSSSLDHVKDMETETIRPSETDLIGPDEPISMETGLKGRDNSEAFGKEGEPMGASAAAAAAAAHMLSEFEEAGSRPLCKTDSPSKRKDKRNRHLGSDGVYLEDLTELEPEVAALYFPKSESSGPLRGAESGSVRSPSMSPQSVGSSGADSGVDSYSDQMGDLPSIAISLCGGLSDNRELTKEQFQEKAISYQQFAESPAIIDDPNLVVKIGSKYYNWSTAAPLMLALQAFQKPLPKATVENIMKEKMPKKGGRWWFSWRSRTSSTKADSVSEHGACVNGDQASKMAAMNRRKEDSSSSDEDHHTAKQSTSVQSEPMLPSMGVSYKKTLRLSSEQLASLQLKDGPNDAVFSVTTQYQGTCRCEGTIYLWNWDDKIVISDIDGTITRSDTLGHILPTLGKDWTHQGIAQLYHKISQNGYKFMYCSARAIGMADMTRGYLHWVNERGTMLPQGPVLLSPSSLFSALHREVIEKKPEKFKIECLTDIRNLFHPNTEPFYAAFGNRPTDVYSYKEVGVQLNRIFTVNPKGELVQEHAKANVSSYVRLGEVVDHMFPLLLRSSTSDFPCSDTYSHFTYWREQLPLVASPPPAAPLQDASGIIAP